MEYDTDLWNKYTDENKENISGDISNFLYYLSIALGTKKICEAGCNIGNNLTAFPSDYSVYGFDLNDSALEKAKKRHPNFTFEHGSLNKIPFPDSFFDLIFTRGVLIHIKADLLDEILTELLRTTKKWIINLEYHGEDGKMIKWKRGNELLWYRNMKERWEKYNVDIISNVDIPLGIDPGKMRLTIIAKK